MRPWPVTRYSYLTQTHLLGGLRDACPGAFATNSFVISLWDRGVAVFIYTHHYLKSDTAPLDQWLQATLAMSESVITFPLSAPQNPRGAREQSGPAFILCDRIQLHASFRAWCPDSLCGLQGDKIDPWMHRTRSSYVRHSMSLCTHELITPAVSFISSGLRRKAKVATDD